MTGIVPQALRLCSYTSVPAWGVRFGARGRLDITSALTPASQTQPGPVLANHRENRSQRAILSPPAVHASSLHPLALLSPASWALRHTSPMPRPPTSSPPPAGFSFAAGSFDFPHASTSPPNAGRSNSANVLRLADEPPERSPAHLDRLIEARRRASRRRLYRLPVPPQDSDYGTYESLRRPLSAYSSRPRATPSERYLQRAQARIDEEREALLNSSTEPFDSLSERPPVVANFEEWVDMANRQSSPGVPDMAHRRSKRRKLDHDSSRITEYHSYKYGYKGQVVPGRLRMEVVSCDGGQIKRDNPMKMYNVENVLKNDKSVYCSESSKCNLLLKHIGDTPFALEKVVIRAPDRGFTSPYVCLFVTR